MAYRRYDKTLEVDGVRTDIPGGGTIVVARWMNPRHRRALINVRRNGTGGADEQEAAARRALVGTVLKGWDGVEFEDPETGEMEPWPFNAENAERALLEFDDFFLDVQQASMDSEKYYRQRVEAASGN